jgi:hypothetical protein
MSDQPDRPPNTGPLAKLGRNDSFAGATRIVVSVGGILLTAIIGWARADIQSALDNIKSNQQAIERLAERTTVLEQRTDSDKESVVEFRQWTTSQVSGLNNQGNTTASDLGHLQSSHERLEGRVRCLEHKVPCPPS